MIDQENLISKVRASLASEIDAAVNEAAAAFVTHLGREPYPGASDLAAARGAAEASLKQRVLSPEWLSAARSGTDVSSADVARLRLGFDAVMQPLLVPAPQDASVISPLRLAMAAAIGAVAGMMLLTPLARLLLDMRDTGLFIGAPLGAGALVLAAWFAAGSKWLRGILTAALGVAAAAEIWGVLTGGGVLRRVWRMLGGRRSAMQRIALYLCIIFVLLFAKRRPDYDRRGYEDTILAALRQWTDEGIIALVLLAGWDAGTVDKSANREDSLYALVARIRDLQAIPKENLEFAIQELVQETRNMGFSGGQGQRPLTWKEDMRREYDTFAHVEPGDLVIVEREPVCIDDAVKSKGLVRKVRGRR